MLNFSNFNDEQKQAICYTGKDPLLLIAGPGSGKTFTILHHLLYLHSSNSYCFNQFFIITFTKQSAKECKNRYQKLMKEHGLSQDMMPWFGTFHSFFYQVLIRTKSGNGTESVRFLEPQNTDELLQKAIERILPPQLRGIIYPRDRKEILETYGYYKNTLHREKIYASLSSELREYAWPLFDAYEELRLQESGVSYDDILYDVYNLFSKNPSLLKRWKESIQGLLVDEFQDTNPIQFQLLKMLYHGKMHFMVVGDDDQAIYGFRGSKPQIMQEFQTVFGARKMQLCLNYRSGSTIVSASGMMISQNQNRIVKRLQAVPANETGQLMVREFATELEQYKQIAEAIRERGGKHFVLYRTNVSMQKGAVLLERLGVPIFMPEQKSEGEFAFLAKDLWMYLSWIYDKDSTAWKNVINRPSRFLSSEILFMADSCNTLGEFIRRVKKEHALSAAGYERLELLQLQKERASKLGIFPCLTYIRKVIKYDTYIDQRYLKNEELRVACKDALGMLISLWKDCKTLEEIQKQSFEKVLKREENRNVTLMTLHASKGLECDTVWIPGCNEGIIPYGSIHNPMFSKETEEEERRLFYVGMTRAKKCLELSYLAVSAENPRPMSHFLNPVKLYLSSSTSSSNSTESKYSSNASATISYSSSSSM